MKYERRIVALVTIGSLLIGSSVAFLPSSSWKSGAREHHNVWNSQERRGHDEFHPTRNRHQDTFRLMNSYLDSLAPSTAEERPSATTQGMKSFHPQRKQQPPSQPAIPVQENNVIETTAEVVTTTDIPATASVPNGIAQNQYFPPPQEPMLQQPQQQTQSNHPNTGVSPPPQSQLDVQQTIPANHEMGYLNQPQSNESIPGSQLPPIPPNVPIPQPPELQPPPSSENYDPHATNFGTGTTQVYPQQPSIQQPPMQYPQGATSYSPKYQAYQMPQPKPQPTATYPNGNAEQQQQQQQQTQIQQPPMQYAPGASSYSPFPENPPPQQPMQQQPLPLETPMYQTQPPPPTAIYPNGTTEQQQHQQQQQQQQQTQTYNPSMGSFPQQDLPLQGPPPPNVPLYGQPVQKPQQEQEQQSPNVAMPPQQPPTGTWDTPMGQEPPQNAQPPPQFDPHELMSQQNLNAGGDNWYDVKTGRRNRIFDNVNPWERDNNPTILPPLNQLQQQNPVPPRPPPFDPHSPSWDRPGMPGGAGTTTNLQGTSWHNDPNSWQGSQGLPYHDHPMNPLAAGMPMATVAPPPLQPMKQNTRQPFDPHNPDWTRPLSSEIQGESRNTWQNHLGVPRVMVDLFSEGRPIDSEIELWQGPSNTPHKIKMYSEDGGIRPFKAVVETPGYGSSIDIKNSGPTAFPIQANVRPMPFRYEPERFKQVQGANSLYTVSLSDDATSALVTLETDGMPLMVLVELWQGPDNTPQKVKVYNEQGVPFQLMVETPGSQCTIAIRNIGPMEFPLYCAVSARVD